MEQKIASLCEQLTSNNKLDRDRGNQQLELDLKINKDLGKDIWSMEGALHKITFIDLKIEFQLLNSTITIQFIIAG